MESDVQGQEWTLRATLVGEVLIEHQSIDPGFDGVRSATVSPETAGQPNGRYRLVAELLTAPDSSAEQAHDVGEEFAHAVAARLSWAAGGRKVNVESIVVQRALGDGAQQAILYGEMIELRPPPRIGLGVLAAKINPKVERAMRWWALGLPPGSPVERLAALNRAADTLAGMLDDVPGGERVCKSCGHREPIGPGGRQRVEALLRKFGCSAELFAELWVSRNEVAHGYGRLTQRDIGRYERHCEALWRLIGRALGQHLGEGGRVQLAA